MKLSTAINIGPDGVQYADDEGVFTSAHPTKVYSAEKPHIRAQSDELKEYVLLLLTQSWANIEGTINVLPANSLALLLRSFEPCIRLYDNKSRVDKHVLMVLINAHIERTIDPYWKGIVSFLLNKQLMNSDSTDDLVSEVIRHYSVAQVRFLTQQQVQNAA